MDLSQLGPLGKQFQQMEEQMVKMREELASEEIEVTAGGGAIKIIVSGTQQIKSIEILPEAITPDDPDKLQNLLVDAVNNAIERSQLHATNRLQSVTGGLNLPGIKP